MHKAIRYLKKIDADPDNVFPKLSFLILQELHTDLAGKTEEDFNQMEERIAPLIENIWRRVTSDTPEPPKPWRYYFFLAAAFGLRIQGGKAAVVRLQRTAKNLAAMGYQKWPLMEPDPAQSQHLLQQALLRFEAENPPEVVRVVLFRHFLAMNFKEMSELLDKPVSELKKVWEASIKRLAQLMHDVLDSSPADHFPLPQSKKKKPLRSQRRRR